MNLPFNAFGGVKIHQFHNSNQNNLKNADIDSLYANLYSELSTTQNSVNVENLISQIHQLEQSKSQADSDVDLLKRLNIGPSYINPQAVLLNPHEIDDGTVSNHQKGFNKNNNNSINQQNNQNKLIIQIIYNKTTGIITNMTISVTE